MEGSAVFRGPGDTDHSSCLGMLVRLSLSVPFSQDQSNKTGVPGLCCLAFQPGWWIQVWVCRGCSSLARGTSLLDLSLPPWDHVIWNNLQGTRGTGICSILLVGSVHLKMCSGWLLGIAISNLLTLCLLFPSASFPDTDPGNLCPSLCCSSRLAPRTPFVSPTPPLYLFYLQSPSCLG